MNTKNSTAVASEVAATLLNMVVVTAAGGAGTMTETGMITVIAVTAMMTAIAMMTVTVMTETETTGGLVHATVAARARRVTGATRIARSLILHISTVSTFRGYIAQPFGVTTCLASRRLP
uniref:Uncharacterized protein n=1 Tax=Octactis speculum TaxID=3111310 RepID=A0A7S2B5A6_9STRA